MNVNWDDDIPNVWENKKCSKPPTQTSYGKKQNNPHLNVVETNSPRPLGTYSIHAEYNLVVYIHVFRKHGMNKKNMRLWINLLAQENWKFDIEKDMQHDIGPAICGRAKVDPWPIRNGSE